VFKQIKLMVYLVGQLFSRCCSQIGERVGWVKASGHCPVLRAISAIPVCALGQSLLAGFLTHAAGRVDGHDLQPFAPRFLTPRAFWPPRRADRSRRAPEPSR